ncbi:ROK family protein [Patescibacteria group bacterium]|nr:ROK family protein [Patescibacteria group bacterium]MBU4580078.1 ROK family protein [Patescibacteria group bacterium]
MKNKANNIFLGVDIGATKTIFLLAEISGAKYKILESAKIATPRKEKEILKMVEENYKSLAEKYSIAGIGIGFCGPVDFKKGIAIKGPRLGTGKIDFKAKLKKKMKVFVKVDNDVRCFLFAESAFGKAQGKKNAVFLTLGTGIGGGIMINGEIYRGAANFAGEFGHMLMGEISKEEEFELVSSGTGLSNVYKKITGKILDSFQIVDLSRKKDFSALAAIDFASKTLGIVLANIIQSFNPEIIVLGGGLSEVDLIIDKAKEYAKKKVLLPSLAKTPIVVSKLGQNAVALGAAWMANLKQSKA